MTNKVHDTIERELAAGDCDVFTRLHELRHYHDERTVALRARLREVQRAYIEDPHHPRKVRLANEHRKQAEDRLRAALADVRARTTVKP